MLAGDSKTIGRSSSSQKNDPFANERLVGVRQQHPTEDVEPGRINYSSRLINNKPNKIPTKASRDDSGLRQSFEGDKLRIGANNYHSAVHLRQAKELNNLSSSSKMMESPTRLPMIGTPVSQKKTNQKVAWPSAKSSAVHGYYEAYRDLIESDISDQNAKNIEAENMMLRNALKDMNENLQRRVEKVKQSELIQKKPEFKDRNFDDKMRTLLKEIENNEKLIAHSEEEYRRLEAKAGQVSEPEYYYDLDKEVREIYRQIEEQKRHNTKLYVSSSATGKNLDRIENITGIPVIMEEANAKESEILVIKRKVEDLKVKNDILKEEKHQKLIKNKKLTEQVKQLTSGNYVDDETERLNIQYKSLQRKLKAVEEDLKLTQNKQKKFLETQKGRELTELFNQHMRDREHFQSLDNMIAEQVTVLRNMVKTHAHTRNRVVEDIINNLTVNLDREEGARERTAQSFEESKSGVEKAYKSMSPSKAKFSSTLGMGIKGNMYDGLPLFSPETTKSKLIKTQQNKVAVRRELQDQRKPMWKELDSKSVSKIDMTLIKTIEEKQPNDGYTPFEGLKKLQKALESGREEFQKSARGEKSGSNSPARSIVKMYDSINSSRVEKKEVFKNPRLGNLPNLKAPEDPKDNIIEQDQHVGLSKKRNNLKPLGLKTKTTEEEFDTEDIIDVKRVDDAGTNRNRKKPTVVEASTENLKSHASSRVQSSTKNKRESHEKLNDDNDAEYESIKPRQKNNLETLPKKKAPAVVDNDEEPIFPKEEKSSRIMKKKDLISQEPSLRNSPEVQDFSQDLTRSKKSDEKRQTARQSVKLDKQESRSRQASPGKRSDLTIDVEAIEKEHEEVFDFGDEEKKTPVQKETSKRVREEKPKDVLEFDTKPYPKQTRPMEKPQSIKKEEDDVFDDAIDNRAKNLQRKNIETKPKPVAKKQDDEFEEFEFND